MYWVLHKLGIQTTLYTTQKSKNIDLQTDEWKPHILDFDESIKSRLDFSSADINGLDLYRKRLLEIEMKNKNFMDEYNRVIVDENLPHADTDDKIHDNYLNMDFVIKGYIAMN